MELEEQKILKRLRKAKEEKNYDHLAVQCHKLGEVRIHQGRYMDALKNFKESLSACEALKDVVRQGCAHRAVGEAYVNLGDYERALRHEKKYLDLVTKGRDLLEQQRAWASIGRSQLCLAESKAEEGDEEEQRKHAFAEAKNAFMKSLAIANDNLGHLQRRDLVEMKGRLVLNLGLVHEYQGDSEEAHKKIKKAVELFQANDLFEDLCRALGSLGTLKLKQGDSEGALKELGKALEICKRLSPDEKVLKTCDVLISQSEVFFSLGEFSAAKHALHKAYNMKPPNEMMRENIEKNLKVAVTALRSERQLQEVDETDWVLKKKLHEEIADCCTEVKSYNKAAEHYKKMLECSESLGESGTALSTALVSVGASYKDDRQYHLALEYFERELDLWDNNPKEAARSLLTLASVHKLCGDSVQQLGCLERARTQAAIAGTTRLQLEALNEIASFHRAQGDTKSADEVENDIVQLRGDSDNSSQEVSSCSQSGEVDNAAWEHTDLATLSSDDSEEEEEQDEIRSTRLRQRTQLKVKRNEKGETQLHTACIKGNIEQVQKLLNMKHPVGIRDNAGWIPLHEAANHGFTEIVQLLLEHGSNVNDKGGRSCDGFTPLHDAASNGHLATMELLIEKGADVTARIFTVPRYTPYNMLVMWHNDHSPLDETTESAYENLCSRMRQILKRAGVSEEVKDAAPAHTLPSLIRQANPTHASPQPSTSSSSSVRQSRISRPTGSRRRGHALSDSDEEESVGLLTRRADSTRLISSDEEDKLQSPSPPLERQQNNSSSEAEEEAPCTRAKPSADKPSASSEYARVMDTLRGKHKHKGAEPFTLRPAQPALLREDEIEADWLEDDLRESQPSKRQRLSSPPLDRPAQPQRSARSARSDSARSDSARSDSARSDSARSDSARSDSARSDSARSGSTRSDSARSGSTRSAGSIRSDSARSEQRTPSPPCMIVDDNDDDDDDLPLIGLSRHKHSPKRIITPVKRSSPCKTATWLASPVKLSQRVEMVPVKVKVQVQEDKFLVPVPGIDLSIGWLADEVAQRYYKLKGLLPKLSLQTQDGALLSNDDPISLICGDTGQPEDVQARVDSVSLPPITARYSEACQAHGCGEDSHVLSSLQSSQATLALHLRCLHLGEQQAPLLQALARQNSLTELSLPGCNFGDSGLDQLCGILGQLCQLTTLDLSGNNITKLGLSSLTLLVADATCLKNLANVSLNHNPLQADALPLLSQLSEGLRALTNLELRNCDLNCTDDQPIDRTPMLSLESIRELDVSHNSLGCSGLGLFFGRMDAWHLHKLNVAHTSLPQQEEGSSVAREVALLLQKSVRGEESGGTLAELDLSGCQLQDQDVYELLNAMADCGVTVKHLAVSSNPALTGLSLRCLLQHRPAFISLSLTGCPSLACALSPEDLPPSLASLRLSAHTLVQQQMITQAWSCARGAQAQHQRGPGGLLVLSSK